MEFLIIFIKYILKPNDCLTVMWKWNDHCSARIRVALVSAWTAMYISSPDHPVLYKRDLGDEFSEVVLSACPVSLLLLKMFCFMWETNYKVGGMSPGHWDVFPVDISPSTREPTQNRHSSNRHPVHLRWTPHDLSWAQSLLPKEYRITRNFLAIGTSCQLVPSWLMVCFYSLYSSFP